MQLSVVTLESAYNELRVVQKYDTGVISRLQNIQILAEKCNPRRKI